ncbi:MAG: tRNA uridine-5-carboxymethylaminomethyl(34) synthesis GTPase MnmE [bacterium]
MDTIVALSTPLGVSGIGLIRLSGPDCQRLACDIFGRKEIKPRYSYLGQYHLLEPADVVADAPLFTYFEGNASYTGEPMLEISCHGNPLILQQIIRDCIQRGCRQAEPGEFTRRAFLNGKIDLCQAEAIEDLIHSQSLQALNIAQKQLSGSLSRKMDAFVDTLTDQVAFVEAYLDFPEEDLPEEDRQNFENKLEDILKQLDVLINAHKFYTPLHNGIQTVIVGAPNAGKSTLLNTLLGQERAIVSDIPGTTRDFITEWYHLEPYTLKLIDTAGLHDTQEKIEKLGIEKTFEQVKKADFILWVLDGSQPWNATLSQLKSLFPQEKTLVILNKSDLGIQSAIKNELEDYDYCEVSLKDEASLSILESAMHLFLSRYYNDFSQVEFMVHERHAEALKQAQTSLNKAKALLNRCGYDDCLASELKNAIYAFETLVGRVDYERVLDKIFSKFCIGK